MKPALTLEVVSTRNNLSSKFGYRSWVVWALAVLLVGCSSGGTETNVNETEVTSTTSSAVIDPPAEADDGANRIDSESLQSPAPPESSSQLSADLPSTTTQKPVAGSGDDSGPKSQPADSSELNPRVPPVTVPEPTDATIPAASAAEVETVEPSVEETWNSFEPGE
jgi:hypothetical protein